MADVAPIPDELLAAGPVIEKNALWADTFQGATTNLALRARHAQDQQRRADYLIAERAAQQQNLIQTNKVAQDYYFKTKQLDIQAQTAEAAMAEREARMKHEEALQPLIIKSKLAQTEADLARTAATVQTSALQAKKDKLEAADTAGFAQHMSEIMDRAKPNEDDYKLGVLRGADAFPHADKALVAKFSAPALQGDEDLTAALANIPPGFKPSQVHRGINGKWGFVAKPESAVADLTPKASVVAWEADRKHWQTERNTHLKIAASATDETAKAEANRRASEAQGQLDKLNTRDPREAATATAAPATTSSEPTKIATAEDFHALPSGSIFIDPNGVKRTKP